MITIVIVEDQGILRESLACTLNLQEDMQVARALSDAADALDVVRETNANLALLDVCTENGSSGIAAAKQIREACPDTKIVIMTGMPEITFIEQAKLAGADSFVYKNVGTEELLGIIRSTANGYSTFPNATQSIFSDASALNETEISILRLVCEAKTRKEIAAELYLSEGTVNATFLRFWPKRATTASCALPCMRYRRVLSFRRWTNKPLAAIEITPFVIWVPPAVYNAKPANEITRSIPLFCF